MTSGSVFMHRLVARLMKLWVFAGFVFILLPIALIIWLSFFTDPLLSLPPTGYSVQWYWHIFGQPQFLNGFVLSLKVALIAMRSEEHTSELQSLMRNSYAVFCLKKKKKHEV